MKQYGLNWQANINSSSDITEVLHYKNSNKKHLDWTTKNDQNPHSLPKSQTECFKHRIINEIRDALFAMILLMQKCMNMN